MSKVGKLPIDLPKETKLEVSQGKVSAVGPMGELTKDVPRSIGVEIKDNQVYVSAKRKDRQVRALHGTYRSIISNMLVGVSKGWEKTLELVGTGYRVVLNGDTLVLNIGFSHPTEFKAPEGITFKTEKTLIYVSGIDKELVGLVAAKIRALRPPEPYKGKGIRYKDEVVRRKPGKAAKAQGVAAA